MIDKLAEKFLGEIYKHYKEQLDPWFIAQRKTIEERKLLASVMNIGGHIQYQICSTGLGVIISAHCELTGESLVLTDFSNW